MTRGHVDLIRRQIEGLNRGDYGASIEGMSPDIEWRVAREHPAARTIHGLEELRSYREDWAQSLGELTYELDEAVDNDDVVVVIGKVCGTGAGSGAKVEVPLALVVRFRGEEVVTVEEYLDPQEALRAA
jgi:ketosteroid isomerase-like protein